MSIHLIFIHSISKGLSKNFLNVSRILIAQETLLNALWGTEWEGSQKGGDKWMYGCFILPYSRN